jgi:hypothetical protein
MRTCRSSSPPREPTAPWRRSRRTLNSPPTRNCSRDYAAQGCPRSSSLASCPNELQTIRAQRPRLASSVFVVSSVSASFLHAQPTRLLSVLAFKKRIDEEERYLFKQYEAVSRFGETLERARPQRGGGCRLRRSAGPLRHGNRVAAARTGRHGAVSTAARRRLPSTTICWPASARQPSYRCAN